MLKYFIDKDSQINIAINPNNVMCVKEVGYGTTIVFVDGSYVVVADSYLNTVTRLNSID